MIRRVAFPTALLLLLLPATGAAAQTGVTVEAVAGVDGYVEPHQPVEVAITIDADVLFVGTIAVSQRSATVAVPAEVPAGSSKTYRVTAPPSAGSVLRVRLVPDGADQPVATETVQLRSHPEDRLLVAVHGAPGAAEALLRLRTDIGSIPVEPVEVASLDRPLRPVGYLLAGIDGALPAETAGWIEEGGRLVVESGSEQALGLDLVPLGAFPGTGSGWFTAGRGEVLAAPDLGDPGGWAPFLRPRPVAVAQPVEFGTPDIALATAAAGSGDRRIPSLPWLLAAVAGYAAIVGPGVFFLLTRLRRRELAWVVVPLISLLALAGFWAAGRQRLQSTLASHASVVLADGVDAGRARSSVVFAAGSAGRHTLTFPEGALVFPTEVVNQFIEFGPPPAVGATGMVEGTSITHDLPQLGYAAGVVIADVEGVPDVAVTEETVTIANDTDLTLFTWGVAVGSAIELGAGPLAPGESGRVGVPRTAQPGMNIADAVIQALAFNEQELRGGGFGGGLLSEDPRTWQVWYPLGQAVSWLVGENRPFVFGYTEDLLVDADIDGRRRSVPGTSVIVVPLDLDPDTLAALGRTGAQLVASPDASVVERGPGFFFVHGSEMILGFGIPAGVAGPVELEFADLEFRPPSRHEAWDWQAGDFVEIAVGPVDRSRFEAANGEVIVRALAGDPAEGDAFVEGVPMSPLSYALTWSSV